MTIQNRRLVPWLLLAGDLCALSLFVIIGQRDHGTANPAQPFISALPDLFQFGIPWAIVAWANGAFRVDTEENRSWGLLARTLQSWFIAAPIGVLAHSLALGRGVILIPFLLVTLGVGGTFILGWRAFFVLIDHFAHRLAHGAKPQRPSTGS